MAWFDLDHFAEQKIKQINALDYELKPTSGGTPAAQLENVIQQYNAKHANDPDFVPVTVRSNFDACNGSDYQPGVVANAVNVSCTPYFDVPYYFTALANYYNSHPEEAPVYANGTVTAEVALNHVFNDLHMSGWQHYLQYGMEMDLDPSRFFDTSAYIAAKVQATGLSREQVISNMKLAQTNPIQDWDANPAIISAQQLVVPNALTPGMADGEQWGAAPEPVDPFTQVQATQALTTAASDTVSGAAGINTLFTASFTGGFAGTTLSPNDVITGGANAHNTLQVTLAGNWDGFAGTSGGGGDNSAPNMTNVGRVLLTQDATDTGNIYSFSLKNTSGVERVDIVNSGAGTAQLTDAAATLKEVRLEGASNAAASNGPTGQPGTYIQYAAGAVGGTQDALDLYVKNVGTAETDTAAAKAALVGSAGIEQLTVHASGTNVLDVSNFAGLTSLAVTGNGNVDVRANQQGITSFDASGASGKVNMQLGNISSATVIKGGLGQDTVTLTQNVSGYPLQAQWTGVETLAMQSNVSSASLDFARSDGALSTAWVAGNSLTLNNVKTPAFTIEQVNSGSNVTVNGQIDNLYWSDQSLATVGGTYTSNVARDVYISVGNKQDVEGAKFNFADARGQINLSVAPQSSPTAQDAGSFADSTIKADSASSFSANVGKLEGKNTFTVVNGTAAAGNSVTITATDAQLGTDNAPVSNTLNAKGAATLNLNLTANCSSGSGNTASISGDASGAQDININVANSATGSAVSLWSLDLSNLKMTDARDVDVTGADGNENVMLGGLGSSAMNGPLDLTVHGLNSFKAGTIKVGEGRDITANIDVKGDVYLGDITAGANANGVLGNVTVNIDTQDNGSVNSGISGTWTVTGNKIALDIQDVQGKVNTATGSAAPKATVLSAQATIDYDGCDNAERVAVSSLGDGVSSFDLGGGMDYLYLGADNVQISNPIQAATKSYNYSHISANGKAAVTVNMSDGYEASAMDTLWVANTDKGVLAVTVNDLTTGKDRILVQSVDNALDIEVAKGILEDHFRIGTLTKVNSGNNATTGYYDALNDNAYYLNGDSTATGITIVQVTGVESEAAVENLFATSTGTTP